MELAGSYFHFNERLNQRYGLDITLEEYTQICRYPIQVLLKNTYKIHGIMKIKNVDVLVVREKDRKRKLLSALPYSNINDEKYKEWTTKNSLKHIKI